jgi:hypothetical protein
VASVDYVNALVVENCLLEHMQDGLLVKRWSHTAVTDVIKMITAATETGTKQREKDMSDYENLERLLNVLKKYKKSEETVGKKHVIYQSYLPMIGIGFYLVSLDMALCSCWRVKKLA